MHFLGLITTVLTSFGIQTALSTHEVSVPSSPSSLGGIYTPTQIDGPIWSPRPEFEQWLRSQVSIQVAKDTETFERVGALKCMKVIYLEKDQLHMLVVRAQKKAQVLDKDYQDMVREMLQECVNTEAQRYKKQQSSSIGSLWKSFHSHIPFVSRGDPFIQKSLVFLDETTALSTRASDLHDLIHTNISTSLSTLDALLDRRLHPCINHNVHENLDEIRAEYLSDTRTVVDDFTQYFVGGQQTIYADLSISLQDMKRRFSSILGVFVEAENNGRATSYLKADVAGSLAAILQRM